MNLGLILVFVSFKKKIISVLEEILPVPVVSWQMIRDNKVKAFAHCCSGLSTTLQKIPEVKECREVTVSFFL
jgi:hypothetical protein